MMKVVVCSGEGQMREICDALEAETAQLRDLVSDLSDQ